MSRKSEFQLKEDHTQTVSIARDEVQEIVPDADFRFTLLMLKDGRKLFVCGTREEVTEHLDQH